MSAKLSPEMEKRIHKLAREKNKSFVEMEIELLDEILKTKEINMNCQDCEHYVRCRVVYIIRQFEERVREISPDYRVDTNKMFKEAAEKCAAFKGSNDANIN